MTISAKACIDAAELLAEREEIAEEMAKLSGATIARIEIQSSYEWEDGNGTKRKSEDWIYGPELKLTPTIRKLLTANVEERIADIDAKLRALGVEPPSASEGGS